MNQPRRGYLSQKLQAIMSRPVKAVLAYQCFCSCLRRLDY